jgi:hypothetical protein
MKYSRQNEISNSVDICQGAADGHDEDRKECNQRFWNRADRADRSLLVKGIVAC